MRWTEHYLDVIPQDLSATLKKPGDFLVTPLEGNRYQVHYRVGLEANDNELRFKPSERIRCVEIDKSEWQGTDDALCEHLASGLKTIVGLDFDKTLTKEHSAREVNRKRTYSDAENYRFESQFDVIDALGRKPSVHLTIATRQVLEIVENHLEAWYSKRAKYSRESLDSIRAFQADLLDACKDVYLRRESDALLAKQEFNDLRTLKLSTVPFVIDIVAAYLVDDDPSEIKACEQVGIQTVEVDGASNSFLRRLVQIFNLNLTVPIQFLPRQAKPNPLLEERPVQRANSKKRLTFMDSEETKDEAKDDNPSPTKMLAEDLEELRLTDGIFTSRT